MTSEQAKAMAEAMGWYEDSYGGHLTADGHIYTATRDNHGDRSHSLTKAGAWEVLVSLPVETEFVLEHHGETRIFYATRYDWEKKELVSYLTEGADGWTDPIEAVTQAWLAMNRSE